MERVFQRCRHVLDETGSDHDECKKHDEPGQTVQDVKSCIDVTVNIQRQFVHGLLTLPRHGGVLKRGRTIQEN